MRATDACGGPERGRKVRGIVSHRARRRAAILAGTQHELIPHDAVFALLDTDRLQPGLREIDWRRHAGIRGIVPAPPADRGPLRVLEHDCRGCRRPDPVDWRAARVDRTAEL